MGETPNPAAGMRGASPRCRFRHETAGRVDAHAGALVEAVVERRRLEPVVGAEDPSRDWAATARVLGRGMARTAPSDERIAAEARELFGYEELRPARRRRSARRSPGATRSW